MGQILALFRGGASGEQIIIDFDNVRPSEQEQAVWDQLNTLLARKDDVLEKVSSYRGQDALIRKAIAERTESNNQNVFLPAEEEAWRVILEQAKTINEFYQFADGLCLSRDVSFPACHFFCRHIYHHGQGLTRSERVPQAHPRTLGTRGEGCLDGQTRALQTAGCCA